MSTKIDASSIEQFNKLPTKEQLYIMEHIGTLDETLSEEIEDMCKTHDSRGTLRASSIPYYLQCPHKGYLDLVCVPRLEVIPPKLRWIFNVGTKVHELIQDDYLPMLVESGRLTSLENEVAVWCEELLMSGHSDGLLIEEHPKWNIRYGIEIKTINNNGFEQVKRSNKPKPYHIQQGLFYQWMMDVPIMLYYYVNKDKQDRLCIPYPFDEKAWEEIKAVLLNIVETMKSGTSPGKITGYHCRDCAYNPLSCQPGKYTRKL